MVDGSLPGPHTETNVGPLQGRARSRGTGNHFLPVPQYHFRVGSNVHQQGYLLLPVHFTGQHTGHCVGPYKTGDIRHRQQQGIAPFR